MVQNAATKNRLRNSGHKSRTDASDSQETSRCVVCTNKTQSEHFINKIQSQKLTPYSRTRYLSWLHQLPTVLCTGCSPLSSLRSATSCLYTGSETCLMAITKYNHQTRTTTNTLYPIMTANPRKTAMYYVERKCWQISGFVPGGTNSKRPQRGGSAVVLNVRHGLAHFEREIGSRLIPVSILGTCLSTLRKDLKHFCHSLSTSPDIPKNQTGIPHHNSPLLLS